MLTLHFPACVKTSTFSSFLLYFPHVWIHMVKVRQIWCFISNNTVAAGLWMVLRWALKVSFASLLLECQHEKCACQKNENTKHTLGCETYHYVPAMLKVKCVKMQSGTEQVRWRGRQLPSSCFMKCVNIQSPQLMMVLLCSSKLCVTPCADLTGCLLGSVKHAPLATTSSVRHITLDHSPPCSPPLSDLHQINGLGISCRGSSMVHCHLTWPVKQISEDKPVLFQRKHTLFLTFVNVCIALGSEHTPENGGSWSTAA